MWNRLNPEKIEVYETSHYPSEVQGAAELAEALYYSTPMRYQQHALITRPIIQFSARRLYFDTPRPARVLTSVTR